MDFFATAAKGTEPALRDELRELGLVGVRADRGGVHFAGELVDGARACLWSRVAVRVLAWRGAFDVRSGNELYEVMNTLEWRHFLTPEKTLAVKASCRSSKLTHTQYIAQRAKDAIVDQLRDDLGARPSVDVDDPDVLVVVHLVKDRADVYVDLAGEPLHRRGWRTRSGEAPLKETLAAAMLRLSGWDRKRPLVDPMCGAGTIAIEAAEWARNVAPGLRRASFGLERWALCDDALKRAMRDMRSEARAAVKKDGPVVRASDIDVAMVDTTRANAKGAGVDIIIEERDVRDLAPLDPPGVVVTNPPYGERLAADDRFFRDMARALLALPRHDVAVLAGAPEIERALGRKPDKWWSVFNGAIECRLLLYRLP
jgi:putative N6-adenine-specific DNA methylase